MSNHFDYVDFKLY